MDNITVSSSCPQCGAPLRLAKNTSISWDEEKKAFLVKIQGTCTPCGIQDEVSIKRLPVLIAKSSNCSCGAGLALKDHNFTFSGTELDFTAVYQCTQCANQQKTTVQRMFTALKGIWRDTTSIEIGPGGVKYSKNGGTGNAP
jgi:RNase P subunit RPR2